MTKNIQSPILGLPKNFRHKMATKILRSPSFGCVIVALPFTLRNILKQKKNYGNFNISTCKNIIFKEKPRKETKLF
jgi:hypothetical protein